MSGLLANFRNTILLSAVLAAVMIFAFGRIAPGGFDLIFWQATLRWVHVVAGILWIGHRASGAMYFDTAGFRSPGISGILRIWTKLK